MAGWGGPRPGSGRPRRKSEEELLERLSPLEPLWYEAMEANLKKKDMKAVELYTKYFFGEPVKRVESKIEGSISGLTVEVINGLKNDEAKNTDIQGL
jgi:hypothetical protein